jgi:hypothetical protein
MKSNTYYEIENAIRQGYELAGIEFDESIGTTRTTLQLGGWTVVYLGLDSRDYIRLSRVRR